MKNSTTVRYLSRNGQRGSRSEHLPITEKKLRESRYCISNCENKNYRIGSKFSVFETTRFFEIVWKVYCI